MALLKTGELDYAFNYASLAKQNGLKTIPLPPQIHLGDPKFADFYATVSVEVPGKKPGHKKELKGAPIVYSISLLKETSHPAASQAFLDFMLGSEGRSLMREMDLTARVPQ